jgi:hypothetical protein
MKRLSSKKLSTFFMRGLDTLWEIHGGWDETRCTRFGGVGHFLVWATCWWNTLPGFVFRDIDILGHRKLFVYSGICLSGRKQLNFASDTGRASNISQSIQQIFPVLRFVQSVDENANLHTGIENTCEKLSTLFYRVKVWSFANVVHLVGFMH